MEKDKVSPRKIVKKLLPPLVADGLRIIAENSFRKPLPPQWHRVEGGVLQGAWLFLSSSNDFAQRMLNCTYEVFFAEAIVSRVKPGWVCYDVGAHLGYYSLMLAKLTGSGGQVHAFEPLAYNLEFIHRHVERNQQSDIVRVHPLAISDNEGTAALFASNTLEDSSMAVLKGARRLNSPYYQRVFERFKEVTVVQQSIDRLVALQVIAPPHLIKIDVEGAEVAVLQGAQETLRQTKPVIVAELHTAANAVECTGLLTKFGYRVLVLEDSKAELCQILAEQ